MRQGIIDTSLGERHGILELLERLRADGVSLHEMEEIGLKCQQAGDRALRPLLRELWRERSGEVITRYAYILDFFDSGKWLDQLIQIALKRRDLKPDGKAAIQVVLEGSGVDLQAPQFRALFGGTGPAATGSSRNALRLGEEGLVNFLDDFLAYPAELQQSLIRELPQAREPQAALFLEALLWHDDRAIVESALEALGRTRQPLATRVLERYLTEGAPDLASAAQRSLRRLSFLGVPSLGPAKLMSFHAGYATAPDGDGYRSLFISRWVGKDRLAALYLQVHERRGLLAAWGSGNLDLEGFQAELEGFSSQDELHQVSPEYVLLLIKDALFWSSQLCYLPADYYLRRSMFEGEDLTPTCYYPSFPEHRTPPLSYRDAEKVCKRLFASPFFAGWFMAQERVYEFAKEYRGGAELESVLERFCAELLAPELELIEERLLKCADLMRQCGRDAAWVGQVVGLANSLSGYRLPLHLHPFLRLFALESMEVAREALGRDEESRLPGASER